MKLSRPVFVFLRDVDQANLQMVFLYEKIRAVGTAIQNADVNDAAEFFQLFEDRLYCKGLGSCNLVGIQRVSNQRASICCCSNFILGNAMLQLCCRAKLEFA